MFYSFFSWWTLETEFKGRGRHPGMLIFPGTRKGEKMRKEQVRQ